MIMHHFQTTMNQNKKTFLIFFFLSTFASFITSFYFNSREQDRIECVWDLICTIDTSTLVVTVIAYREPFSCVRIKELSRPIE